MSRILRRQGYHLFGYLALGAILVFAALQMPERYNRVWSVSALEWILFSWALAFMHQAWILFFWRMEFYRGRISAWMGKAGFLIYRIGFVAFMLARLLALVPISSSTAGTMPFPRYASTAIIAVTALPIVWGLYSVLFYFGVNRAFGADHFDPAYRSGALEKRGIFMYIPNSMYTVVLLLVYHPGLYWESRLGLIVAAAHHAFVWLHYFCTEKPDMKEIYGPDA